MGTKNYLQLLHKNAASLKLGEAPSWVATTNSPSINYLFGKQGGLPAGYSALIYGPPKSGKSLLTLSFAGHLLQNDPEAIVLHFDTEYRDNFSHWIKAFGIDTERFVSYATNDPTQIFDYIAKDIKAMLQDGAKIKMIIIDSLAMIQYPKEAGKDYSTDMVIGDAASYLPGAMKMILPIIRQFKIALFLCQHVRDNMDPATSKYRPYVIPGGKGLKHAVEAWMLVEKINSKDSRVFHPTQKDGAGNPIQIGHTIRIKMEENSLGPQNRAVEVDLSYTDGVINIHDQIASLATSMGVATMNGSWIQYKDKKWHGVHNFAIAIRDDYELARELIIKIREADFS